MLAERIVNELKIEPEFLRTVIASASFRYKEYPVPKKNGTFRIVSQPSRELKLLQRWLVDRVFNKFPLHRAASAYRAGASIVRNASVHQRRNFLLKVDFREFFPSLRGRDVNAVLIANSQRTSGLVETDDDRGVVRKLVCRRDQLTIGAPSSPVLSNLIMFEFDDQWSRYCRERGVAYSRYADDLYFSTDEPNILDHLLVDLRLDLRVREWPKLVINDEKTVFTSRKRRKMVTGLLITPSGHISLGRKRMRFIKGLVFRNSLGQLDHKSALKLKGLIAFANSVDSSFVDRLRAKFGADALCELRD